MESLLKFNSLESINEFIGDSNAFVIIFFIHEERVHDTFESDILKYSNSHDNQTDYEIIFGVFLTNTNMGFIKFYRNHYLLDGETIHFYLPRPFSSLLPRILPAISRLTQITLSDDVLEADLDRILDACGRGSSKAELSLLKEALMSPSYNGKIDSYRQGCNERRKGGLQQVALATPLMFAMGPANNMDVVRELVEGQKCDINAVCSQGNSAIDYAFMWENLRFVCYLITQGANVSHILNSEANKREIWKFRYDIMKHCRVINKTIEELYEILNESKLYIVSLDILSFTYRPKMDIT